MTEIELVLSVIGLFLLRIGLPVLLLVILGKIIDNWQSNQINKYRDR